jgi:hypothetical protein
MSETKYVAISGRIPKDMHDEMLRVADVLNMSSIQIINASIDAFLKLVKDKENEPDDLKVARFAYDLKNKK